jgi:hypothetical protein
MGTVELDPGALRKLGKAEFERLCCHVLLKFELEQRHTWPWGQPDDPAGEVGQTDGGRDFSIDIQEQPRRPLAEFPYAITADELGITWYSCKNTKQEDNARQLVLRDVRPSPSKLRTLWPGTEALPPDLEKACRQDGTLSKQLLDMLVGGGRYFVLIAAQVPKKSDLQRDVVTELERWCRALLGQPVDLRARVRIIDANDLARFINHHHVKLPQELERELGIDGPQGLLSWGSWLDRFEADRGTPTFEPDDDRRQKIARIRALASREPNVGGLHHAWIAGPPGVGKTRLVIEALRGAPRHDHRVLFTEDPDAARQAIDSPWFSSMDDVILVVDECSDVRVNELIRAFGHCNGARHNSLILIGPLPENYSNPRQPPSELSKLPNSIIRQIIRNVAETSLDEVALEHLADLVDGYPHYAVLLARDLSPEDTEPLAHVSTWSDWDVAQRALAGRPGDDGEAWRKRVEQRAKALLAVAIVPHLVWDGLDRETEDALGRALQLEFFVLRQGAEDCERRGVLRHVKSQGHQYISPKILGKLILERFLGGDPNGPDLGPRIKRELPSYYGDLCRSAQGYGADQRVQRRLADLDLAAPDAYTWERLDMLAQWHPESTAKSLRWLFAQQAPEEIVEGDLLNAVFFALTHLCRRKLGFGHFQLAEDALFRLALAASRQDRPARRHHHGVSLREVVIAWTSVFSPVNSTHQSLEMRLGLLQSRARDPDPMVRKLIIEAIETFIDPTSPAYVHSQRDLIDGEWPRLDGAELTQARCRLSRDLLELARDTDESVAAAARHALAKTLRSRLSTSALAEDLKDLTEMARLWTPSQKRHLHDALDDFQRHDMHSMPANEARDEAVEQLRTALVVEDLVDRINMRIGRWHPDLVSDDDDDLSLAQTREGDHALALELLQHPTRWDAALSWLEQPEAVRSADFMRALGVEDERDILLDALMERIPGHGSSRNLAKYMQGRHDRLGDAGTDAWLCAALPHPDVHEALARLIAVLPGNDERFDAMITLVEAETLDDESRERLAQGRWITEALPAPNKLREAMRKLAGRAKDALLLLVLADSLMRTDDRPLERELVELVIGALRDHATLASRSLALRRWQSVARNLFATGHVDDVLAMLLDVLSSDETQMARTALDILEEVLAHATPEQFWQALQPRLGRRRLVSRFYYGGRRDRTSIHPLLHIPEDAVLRAAKDDSSVARALGDLSYPYQERLEPLAVRLISELGAGSPAARAIAARAGSTPWAVHSLGHFHLQQAAHARAWSKTSDLEVRRWGEALAESLEARAADELASEAFERKLG